MAMSTRLLRPDGFVLSWLSVLLIVLGSLSWLPAAAQDATPGDVQAPPVAETVMPPESDAVQPTLAPATEAATLPPAEPMPSKEATNEPPAARTSLITTLAAPQVTGITLTCAVAGSVIDGAVVVSDPDSTTILLRFMTTDIPAIGSLQDISIDLSTGQGAYAFEAELEADDVKDSTTMEVVVVGPDESPVSNAVAVQAASDGTTTCVPDPSTSPTEPTATEAGGVATATATVTAIATGTTTPALSVGRVSNTGSSNLNCREQPNTSSAIIVRLPAGANVDVRGATAGGWAPVRCNNRDGWVSADTSSLPPLRFRRPRRLRPPPPPPPPLQRPLAR